MTFSNVRVPLLRTSRSDLTPHYRDTSPAPVEGQEDLQTMGHSAEVVVVTRLGVARGVLVVVEVFLVQVTYPVAEVR